MYLKSGRKRKGDRKKKGKNKLFLDQQKKILKNKGEETAY